jgi:hypothetical protein
MRIESSGVWMSSSHELEKRQTQTENRDIWGDPLQLKAGREKRPQDKA